ncbi:MAG: hypothetical protein K2N67_03110 [Mucispirillum sp.]|nr:hypothetical protein [Mucispirillum sp.]
MIDAVFGAATALNAAATVSAVTANNIANVRTPSFKSKMAVLSELASSGVKVNAIRENGSFGTAVPSGVPTDIAIFGRDNPKDLMNIYGDIARRFSIDDFGNFRGPAGELLFTGAGGNVTLDTDGNLFKDGEPIGVITPTENNGYVPTGYGILYGYIAGSNVNIADELITNTVNLRFFQFNAITVKTADEMLGTVINLKG